MCMSVCVCLCVCVCVCRQPECPNGGVHAETYSSRSQLGEMLGLAAHPRSSGQHQGQVWDDSSALCLSEWPVPGG